jgi:hypothetical protein
MAANIIKNGGVPDRIMESDVNPVSLKKVLIYNRYLKYDSLMLVSVAE